MNEFLSLIISIISLSTSQVCDINLDGKGDFVYIENKQAFAEVSGEIIFKSNEEYEIKEVFCTDIDGDNVPEISLSLWKRGNFGAAKPFWITENDESYKMHLFLYKYKDGKLKPFWHSSSLARQNLKLIPIYKGFIALEKSYENYIFSLSKAKWESWGFEVETIYGYQF